MRKRLSLVLAAIALIGSAAGIVPSHAADACASDGISFRDPIRLGTGRGYEPGIDVDSAGTIFVTAHKLSLVREEGTRLASFLWRSTDGGRTFSDMTDVAGANRALYALEGDLAVDAEDRLYFVDTWAADNHFYRWSNHGATLDLVRPGVVSYEVDDRPWLAAHHDGYLYYMSNTGYKHDGRLTVHRSTDGGFTVDPIGFTFPESGWGFLDADPNSDHVYAFMNDVFYGTGPLGAATSLTMWVSPDRGETWSPSPVADYVYGYQADPDHHDAYPVVAVSPADGSVYALWTDNGRAVMLARSTDHGGTWTVRDVTPFEGLFSYAWLDVAPNGDVGIVFTADPASLSGAINYVYGMIWRPKAGCETEDGGTCVGPAVAYGRMDPVTVGGYASQADFFQVAFTPDGRLHSSWTGRGNAIMYTAQTAGFNLGDAVPCGVVGTP